MTAPSLSEPASDGWQSVHLVEEAPDVESLRSGGVHVAEVAGSSIESKQDLMAALASALEFPDYFGGNWDALDEVLRDLGSLLDAKGYVVAIAEAESLWRRSPELVGMLVRTWIEVAGTWVEKGVPFHLVFVR